MKGTRLHFLLAAFAALAIVMFFPSCARSQEAATASSAGTLAEMAELYVFNDSGRTLIPGNQAINDDGKTLASLPRQSWAKIGIAPGLHVLKPFPPLWNQEVTINAVAGHRYYVLVAYRPERSWAGPAAGAPLILREITEEEAAPLLREMREQK
ncbi:MAG TPA: hypothetical protein VJ698_19210 [Noviherbaspirillum sp.]|uniref:hypothetical protein n=1 Tax=Noviherbaspirillum sp. TaxID=1926288 RepID=UPI002B459FC4|nr:hypothetical protein [Noviherbaspirillum sp.]HJV87606.1 hypothetical protein [Noviherbaspirillum sp.]